MSNSAPFQLVHRLVNLADLMKPFLNRHHTLGDRAMKYIAYATALRYKELEYFSKASPAVAESLISINVRSQQHDVAWSTLITARDSYNGQTRWAV
ncbi:hypothetical protein NP233_g1727 [Leucocoprinus birnbaumii]|uniref:Uncharacterized protein n=1 Tax=Leucocoprinus birnbaumii TaxID=56174 RepID=A0AAD5W0E2_9AGAR|nr:hypothetical protein NP233_g1727 [Leucocoprinus birnbaumii]